MDKNCKVIKDLLPSYIDHVTSEETNKFIEEHLKECKECKKYFDEMNSEVEKEKIKDIEMVKEIKKYKRKMFRLKFLISTIIVLALIGIICTLGYKYYIVCKTIENSFVNAKYLNYKIEEYDESIEKNKDYYTTYIFEGVMRKEYAGETVEYWDKDNNHYYIDNENKTYYIEKEDLYDEEKNQYNKELIEYINPIPEYKVLLDNKENSVIDILKFILFTDDLYVGKEGFRNEEHFVIKTNFNGVRIFIDMDTFNIERVQHGPSESKDYRINENTARYHDVKMPDLSEYKLVNN